MQDTLTQQYTPQLAIDQAKRAVPQIVAAIDADVPV
jgi:hypothetical protein